MGVAPYGATPITMNMHISLSGYTHCRSYGDNAYLFNRHTWASAYVRDVASFKNFFSRHPINVEDEIHRIANDAGLKDATVILDFHEVFDSLIADGYFAVGDHEGLVDGARYSNDVLKWNDSVRDVQTQATANVDSKDDHYEKASDELSRYFADHPTPFELCIDLTRACTERCVHCYVPGFQNIFLPYEIVKKVLSEFTAMGGLKVKLTGGECMLHPDFERIVALARTHDTVISVLSNLTCCDLEKAQAMKVAGVAVVQVSLYGMTPETHEAVTRVKGSLAKTLCGIKMLQDAGVPVQIHCPVLKQNVAGIDAVARYGRERGMKTTFDAVMMSRADHKCNESCGLSDAELRQFIEANEELPDKLPICSDKEAGERVCEIGMSKICLSAEGKYYPCNGCYGQILGDCRRQTLAEVWNDEPIKRLRALRMRDLSACRVCSDRMFCAPCPSRNFNANGDLTLPDGTMCKAAACRRNIVENRAKEN